MRLLQLASKNYVVGLHWDMPVNRKRKRKLTVSLLRQEIAADPTYADYDLVVFRGVSQFGLGTGTSLDERRSWLGASSLAALIQQQHESFIGLFLLHDVSFTPFWWVCIIKSGLVAAGGDVTFAIDELENVERHINDKKDRLRDFDKEIRLDAYDSSLSWLTPYLRSQASFLEQALGRGRFPLQLLRKKPNTPLWLALGGAGLAALMTYGVLLYQDRQMAERAALTARLALEHKEALKQDLLQRPEQHFAMPWLSSPSIRDGWEQCLPAMMATPLSASGWSLAGLLCAKGTLRVEWRYEDGADYVSLPPRARLDAESPRQKAVAFLQLSPVELTRPELPYKALPDENALRQALYQLAASMDVNITFDVAQPERRTVEKMELVAPWRVGKWSLADVPAGVVLDGSLALALDALPAVTLHAVAYKNNKWTLSGNVYVQKN